MVNNLELIIKAAYYAFKNAQSCAALENERVSFLGKKSTISELLKKIGKLDIENRKIEGIKIHTIKQKIEEMFRVRHQELEDQILSNKLITEKIDITLPGRKHFSNGTLHPIMQTCERIEYIFSSIGFDIIDGPEIETEWFNFSALNNPINHPARSMQDTFYIDAKDEYGSLLLLRTHTSSMQVRYANLHKPPIKVIISGRTYRADNDSTHSPMFSQIEGLWIDKNISFADLKGVYTNFLYHFFDCKDITIRFRPSYFPFTEPSAEIDMQFNVGDNKTNNWLEIAGAGQVHPNVIRNMNLDPECYMGFAFGSGIERLTMLRYGINNIRLFFDNDIRFLRQFT